MTQKINGSQWDTFTAVRKRTSCNGLAMMPVAGPYPTPSVVVALHGGLEEDMILFMAARRGEPPIVPAPYTNNPNRVFLRGEQSTPFPMPAINGVKAYGMCGFYVWGILAPEGLASDFMIGNVPFPGLEYQDERIPESYLSYTMLNQRVTRTVDGEIVPTLPELLKAINDLQKPELRRVIQDQNARA